MFGVYGAPAQNCRVNCAACSPPVMLEWWLYSESYIYIFTAAVRDAVARDFGLILAICGSSKRAAKCHYVLDFTSRSRRSVVATAEKPSRALVFGCGTPYSRRATAAEMEESGRTDAVRPAHGANTRHYTYVKRRSKGGWTSALGRVALQLRWTPWAASR